jgi:recombination protein RecR
MKGDVMLNDLPTLMQLIKQLQHVPYLASKNVYRVAEHFLRMKPAEMEQFCAVLLEAKRRIILCSICFCWQEYNQDCSFCASSKRDQQLVCVVESWQDLLSIEKTRGYGGVYHVLGGAISPLEGIGPENLTIEPLLARIENVNVKEIILATNQTPEGEATAAYIASKLKEKSTIVTCLARGLPVGSSLDAIDRVTVYKALSERRLF